MGRLAHQDLTTKLPVCFHLPGHLQLPQAFLMILYYYYYYYHYYYYYCFCYTTTATTTTTASINDTKQSSHAENGTHI